MTMAQSVTLSTISRNASSVQRSFSSTCLRAELSVPIRRYPMIPPAQVTEFEDEMRKAGADWQVIAYGNTVHSFTNPDAGKTVKLDGVAYNAQTDKRSWAAMRSFFAEIFA